MTANFSGLGIIFNQGAISWKLHAFLHAKTVNATVYKPKASNGCQLIHKFNEPSTVRKERTSFHLTQKTVEQTYDGMVNDALGVIEQRFVAPIRIDSSHGWQHLPFSFHAPTAFRERVESRCGDWFLCYFTVNSNLCILFNVHSQFNPCLHIHGSKPAMKSPVVIEISSSDEDGTPQSRRSHKRAFESSTDDEDDFDDVAIIEKPQSRKRLKDGEDIEVLDDDCIILDSDPEKIDIGPEIRSYGSNDLMVTAERGHVACRDYPHARHLCVKFSFKNTPHEKHCELCHCYVCDKPAPCSVWSNAYSSSHCHASDKEERWKNLRRVYKLTHSYKT
eukprot:Gb_38778 [translate_table: standard]